MTPCGSSTSRHEGPVLRVSLSHGHSCANYGANEQEEVPMGSQPRGHEPAASPDLARPADIHRRETGELLRRAQAGDRAALTRSSSD